jgi:autotransporter-associated beta strand protein
MKIKLKFLQYNISHAQGMLPDIKSLCARACHLLIATMALFSIATTGSGAVLFWDAGNTNNGAVIDSGSGSWNIDTTTNLNWNNGSANVNWTQTSTVVGLNGATFTGPDAPDGTYQVTVDGGQVAVTNLTINASGYAFSGSPIYLNLATPLFLIADGKSVVISNNVTGNNSTSEFRLGTNGAPATVTLLGTFTGFQPLFSSTNGSIFYLGGSGSNPEYSDGTAHVNADVRMTNGIWNSSGAFVIGRQRPGQTQPLNATGSFTVDGPTTVFNQNSDYLSLGRDSVWNATLIIQNGATLNDQISTANNNPGIGLPRPGSVGANNQSWLKMYGGTLNMGSAGVVNPMPIYLQDGGSSPGQISVLTQTGGVINAWGGIVMGGASATRTGGSAFVTNSGGYLYLGAKGGDGLRAGANLPPTNRIVFSGGTVGALQSWNSPLPITLDTLNGNITFQCADPGLNPLNITLSGALTGPGGFNKTGGGQLTLLGVNSYVGSTVVSNGVLQLTTAITASTNGPVTLDGSAGSPDLMLKVSNQGHFWSVGTMSFASGSPTLDIQYSQVTPSTTVAAIQVNGDLNFTAMPNVVITNASALALGTYPLIKYTGNSSGTAPTTVTLPTSGYCSGYVSNSATAKTFFLVITQSTFSTALVWKTGDGNWDFTSFNWKKSANPSIQYSDGNLVQFDDSSPSTNIVVTLNTTVSPTDVSFNNLTNAFTIVGNGNLATSSGGNLELVGGGTVTLATTNTYTGGTIVSVGSLLNINSGGNGGGTPIGTGPLTLNANARLGTTAGSAIALQYPVPEQWNGNFSYVGTNDLNMGSGAVTLTENTTVNVVTNNLTIGGAINDNGNSKQVIKTGNGTLTLAAGNNWGGLQLQAGQLNLNSAGAAGFGAVTITGGSIDNTSSADVTLGAGAYHFSGIPAGGIFTFFGTTNLNLGAGSIDANNGGLVLNVVSNVFRTEGDINGGNSVVTKTGNGTWQLAGVGPNNSVVVTVNRGELDLARDAGRSIGTGGGGSYGGSHGLVVTSNALAVITGGSGSQIAAGNYVEVILDSGGLDLNGHDQGLDMIGMTNGVLRNSAAGSSPTVTIIGTAGTHPTNAITLSGANCQFDVPTVDANLNVNSVVNGGGTLVKTGLGTVTLLQSNTYRGNITVSNGTLSVSYPDITNSATVTVSTNSVLGNNGVLNLNFANAETNVVAALILGGISKPAGVYTATTDPLYISGSGSLQVVPQATINPNPGAILLSGSGAVLGLSWPTNAGWILQSNSVSLTATNFWFAYPNSTNLTNVSIPIDSTSTNVFYRLLRPF